MKPPVIVIPGITASSLKDFYPGDAEAVWGVIGKDYERVALHPDDLRFEQLEPALVRPNEAFGIPYEQLVKELRHDLSPSWEEPRPVYAFAHDWRQPLRRIVDELAEFIDEVVRRTALMRHYARSGYTATAGRVDLVGHSMGGLIASGYLARHKTDHKVRKVVTLGTPFGGSFEAVIKVITGTSGLTGGVPKSREREVARLTPALYHLLPDRELTVQRGTGKLPRSLFKAGLWQHGVLETLASHIERIGIAPASTRSGRWEQAVELLQNMLDEARAFRKEVAGLSLEGVGLTEDDWLAVVGLGDETRVHLRIDDKGKRQGPWFDLTSLDRKNGYPMPMIQDGTVTAGLTDTGDGTVPYWAAVPSFLDPGKLVCISSDDFGYWELTDRLIEWKTNLHSMLPAMNRVIKLSAAFLQSDAGEKAGGHPGSVDAARPAVSRPARVGTRRSSGSRKRFRKGSAGSSELRTCRWRRPSTSSYVWGASTATPILESTAATPRDQHSMGGSSHARPRRADWAVDHRERQGIRRVDPGPAGTHRGPHRGDGGHRSSAPRSICDRGPAEGRARLPGRLPQRAVPFRGPRFGADPRTVDRHDAPGRRRGRRHGRGACPFDRSAFEEPDLPHEIGQLSAGADGELLVDVG